MRSIALLFFMTLLLGTEPALAKKIALVPGNQEYTNIEPLKNPENDARDAAQALRSLENESCLLPVNAIVDACRELLSLQHRSLLESAVNEGTFRGGLIKAFERSHGLSVTGAATETLLEHLVAAKGAVRSVKPGEPVAGEKWTNSLEMDFVMIPPGSYHMGDLSGMGEADEKPVREVPIRKHFRLMTTEVTKEQFTAFVNATGYRSDAEKNTGGSDGCYSYLGGADFGWTKGSSWRDPGFKQGANEPVVCVSHNDAVAYIEWLSEETGEPYRLPSEAEWEYAARAGSATEYYFGNNESDLCRYANGADQQAKQRIPDWPVSGCDDGALFTASVGRYQPNAFGLYDMLGNVWEWTQDCWNDSYSGAPADGSAWVRGDCDRRVLRGGSWVNKPAHLRTALRDGFTASNRSSFNGFRLVQGR